MKSIETSWQLFKIHIQKYTYISIASSRKPVSESV
jgi:hypothetical protein